MSDGNERGIAGEKAACDYLKKMGAEILATNYHTKYGEIDIIAKSGENICFVEVKTRGENSMGEPCEAVGISKQKKIIFSALIFMNEGGISLQPRFDVIEVICSKNPQAPIKEMRIHKNAFDVNKKNTKGMNF
ncbi:MAG: YraN family protein [Oscillospiraceae bacterium]